VAEVLSTTATAVFDDAAHYARLYGSAPRRFAFGAETLEEALAWQEEFRPELRRALGLENMEADLEGHEPRAEKTDEADMGSYVRERWWLWTEPNLPLPFWLLVPKGAEGPLPVVLTPHGHGSPDMYVGISRNEEERRKIEEGDRDVAVQAVREGYIALAPTARGFGETRAAADREAERLSSCRTRELHGLLVGRTAIGERVWDVSRLLDWALARPDVDGSRIAITGNSGGGTVSLFAAACDERIAVAAPSSYFCTFAGSIGSIHHCDCNYVPGIMRLGEMHDVAGLVAPRPFLAIAGREDEIFPIRHVREAFGRLKSVYEVMGVPDRAELHEGDGGHRYYAAASWPFVRKWFGRAATAGGRTEEMERPP
jgi:dienelactone hydrolase